MGRADHYIGDTLEQTARHDTDVMHSAGIRPHSFRLTSQDGDMTSGPPAALFLILALLIVVLRHERGRCGAENGRRDSEGENPTNIHHASLITEVGSPGQGQPRF